MVGRVVDAVVSRMVERLWANPSVARCLAPFLFYRAPAYEFGEEQRRAFESLYESARHSTENRVGYDLPYPKHEFLAYLARDKPVVLHGSTESDISEVQPQEQEDYAGETRTAVFATRDPLWATFFALVDQESVPGSVRNAGFVAEPASGDPDRYYFFSLSKPAVRAQPWRDGTVYVLPEDTFDPPDVEGVGFDEWYSSSAVTPITGLPVEPAAFPCLDDVVGHTEAESIFTTWAAYRLRVRLRRRRRARPA